MALPRIDSQFAHPPCGEFRLQSRLGYVRNNCYFCMLEIVARVAQLDRASAYGAEGWEFKSPLRTPSRQSMSGSKLSERGGTE